MEFSQVVRERYSHKVAFDPNQPVSKTDLRAVVDAGRLAPSAMNGQSPEFVIIDDPALVARFHDLHDNVPLSTAPAFVALLTQPRVRQVLDTETECLLCDVAAALMAMLLAATDLGLCCGWLDGPFTDAGVQKAACELLNVPEDRMLFAVVPLGRAAEEDPRRPKKPFEQRASWNTYSIPR